MEAGSSPAGVARRVSGDGSDEDVWAKTCAILHAAIRADLTAFVRVNS